MKYPKEYEEHISYYQGQIEKAKMSLDDILMIKKLFPDMYIYISGNDLYCYAPVKSMDEVKSILKTFALVGILIDHFKESDNNPLWYLKGKKSRIILSPSWPDETEKGATCKLVKISEEVVVQPKYKLICDKMH